MTTTPADLEPLLTGPRSPQRAFSYFPDRWRAWVGDLDGVGEVLDGLPSSIDRGAAAEIVADLLPENVAGAFTVSMIWGHGRSGYGPYRTARVLTASTHPAGSPLSPSVVDRLRESVDVTRRDGPAEGYRFLNNRPGKVAGLGPAFFTKWLYFVSALGSTTTPSAAPILDALVLKWLADREVLVRAGYTKDYAHYVELLSSWGEPHGLGPAEVEERIFRLIRNDGT